jgi:transcriptional regulator with PAS, ATPase and Fis domain
MEQSILSEGCETLTQDVLQYEAGIIERALLTSHGSVTKAARKLGITHQGLAFILSGRHKKLLSLRGEIKRRRKSIIKKKKRA